jgi:glycosyltransferase involved in cell wall biosynthesis
MACIVSVVLPTYNRASTLERAIRSVLYQTFTDFEVIIVDDRSNDGTQGVLERYAAHDKVRVVTQLERGCALARNLGVSISEGRYIAFQDSDDEWHPDFLAKAVRALDRASAETGVFYSDMLRVDVHGHATPWNSPEVQKGVLIDEASLDFQVTGIGVQSTVTRRECFAAIGGFDKGLPRFIDLELFIRLAQQFQFHHCREALVKYHAMEGISTNRAALVTARRHLLNKYRSRLARQKLHLAQQYLWLATALEQNGNTIASWLYAIRALFTLPRWRIRREARMIFLRSVFARRR